MKNCFCYLVNHSGHNSVDNCVKSLKLLNTNYLRRHPYDVDILMFHEAGLTYDMQRTLAAASDTPLKFIPIEFKLPDHIKEMGTSARPGYMHMCRFMGNTIFQHPALDDYRYYCRLDTDSYILSSVKPDIFEDAVQNDVHYGFIDDSIVDQPFFTCGLWDTSKRFIDAHPEIPTYAKLYTDIQEGHLYYTNFELCSIQWFRSAPWTLFFEAVDQAGGIYKYRWGDHIIRYIGVRSFMHPRHIRRITSVHYRHDIIEANRPRTCP